MDEYDIRHLIHNGFIVVELRKGIYGLPQAGLLANLQLKKHLADHDYVPVSHTAGLFRHRTRPITFSLCVDDFGVKYVSSCITFGKRVETKVQNHNRLDRISLCWAYLTLELQGQNG
jgi:hypothetical protein